MLSVGAMRNFFNRFGNGCAILILGVFAVSLVAGYNFGGRNGGGGGRSEKAAAVIATVNGQQLTEADFQDMYDRIIQRGGSPEPGRAFAAAQGEAMDNLIKKTVIYQEADRRHARPLDADIDKAVDQYRDSVAKRLSKTKLTDQEWDNFLMNNKGMTVSDLRAEIAKELIPLALLNQLKGEEKVTEPEAHNQNAQVHLVMVTVPYQEAGGPPPGPKKKPLPSQAEARQRIDALYQKIKAGTDIKAVAKSNPDDPRADRSGDAGTIAEYPNQGQGAFSIDLSLLYGPAFADAIHKLSEGQTTDVVPLSGLEKGFAVAKLVTRTVPTPKDYDPKKAVAALTEQRAGKKFDQLIRTLSKSAKVDIKDPDKKAYYDYAKMELASREMMQDMQNGIATTPPTKAETDAQEALVNKEFDEMLKRHPDDTTAAIIVAEDIKAHKLMEPGAQDRLLKLNELIAKNTDDTDKHFELADTYREKKQYDKAKEHLDRIAKLLSYNTPTDVDAMKKADTTHTRLESAYRAINATVEADREKQAVADLQNKITAAAIKDEMQKREAAREAAARKAADKAAEKAAGKAAGKATGKSGKPVGTASAPDPANTITLQPGGSSGSSQPIQLTPTPSSESGVPGLGGGSTPPLVPSPPTKKP